MKQLSSKFPIASKPTVVSALSLAVLLIAAGACGGEDDPDQQIDPPSTSEDTGTDTEPEMDADSGSDTTSMKDVGVDTSDGGDTTEETDGGMTECGAEVGTECGMDEICVDGVCRDAARDKCLGAADKGTLSAGGSFTVSGSFDGEETSALSTSCAKTAQVPERVYKFEVADDSLIEFSTDYAVTFDAKVEFRRGGCRNVDSEAKSCFDTGNSFWASGGETVYMVVERNDAAEGSFSIDVSAEGVACNPNAYSCSSEDTLQYCQWKDEMANPVEFQCPDSCKGTRCTGTACDNAIEVTESRTYSGDLEVFNAQMNFDQTNETCNVGDDKTVSPTTRGSEVIFKASLQEGESLSIDLSGDEQDNLIFITETCPEDLSQISCLAATDDETLSNWQAPSEGVYYIIVEKFFGPEQGEFEYDISVNSR